MQTVELSVVMIVIVTTSSFQSLVKSPLVHGVNTWPHIYIHLSKASQIQATAAPCHSHFRSVDV